MTKYKGPTKIYLLSHIRQSADELWNMEKIIGCFATRGAAEAALKRVRNLPGFVDYPGEWGLDEHGFVIAEYQIDEASSMLEGFVLWKDT